MATQFSNLVTFANLNPIKLTRDNYPIWLPQIVPHLKGGNVYGYVDGSITCPPEFIETTKDIVVTKTPNPAYQTWQMQDQIILGTINSAISKNLLIHVTRCTTLRQAWTTLETLLKSQSHSRKMNVHFQLSTLKKGSSSVADYYHRFQTLIDTLAFVGHPLNEVDQQGFLQPCD
jgi:hypothetical protein